MRKHRKSCRRVTQPDQSYFCSCDVSGCFVPNFLLEALLRSHRYMTSDSALRHPSSRLLCRERNKAALKIVMGYAVHTLDAEHRHSAVTRNFPQVAVQATGLRGKV